MKSLFVIASKSVSRTVAKSSLRDERISPIGDMAAPVSSQANQVVDPVVFCCNTLRTIDVGEISTPFS